jgi:CDP-diacylglycerol--glycerol-3-phosphate 3-phosphatidyltransferase
MCGVVALQIGSARRYDGPMGKSDRALAFGLLAMLCLFGYIHEQVLLIAQVGIFLMLIITVFNRARSALKASKR